MGFFVKNTIKFVSRDDIKLNLPCVFLRIGSLDRNRGKTKFVIGVIYRHPKQTGDRIDEFDKALNETLHKMNMK